MRKDREKKAKSRAQRKGTVMPNNDRRAGSVEPGWGDNELLQEMIDQALKTTAQASAAIDDALAFVGASNQRIAAMEAQRIGR